MDVLMFWTCTTTIGIYIIICAVFVIYLPLIFSCVLFKQKKTRKSKLTESQTLAKDKSLCHEHTDEQSSHHFVPTDAIDITTHRSHVSITVEDYTRRYSVNNIITSTMSEESNFQSLVSISVEDVTKSYSKLKTTLYHGLMSQSHDTFQSSSLVSVTMEDQTK